MSALQAQLPLRVSARTALLDVRACRAALGVDEDSVLGLVDSGDLRWAFDLALAPGGERREVRVWAPCVLAIQHGQIQPGTTLREVIPQIVPAGRARLRSGEVRQLLLVSQQTVSRWAAAGELRGEISGHQLWINAGSLAALLERRAIR